MSTALKSTILICGDDDFQVSQEARRLIDRLVPPDARTVGLETIDGRVETIDESVNVIRACCEALATDSLFGGGDKLVWLREPAFLSSDRQARSEAVKARLSDLVALIKAGLPEGQRLLVTTFKINRGSAFFKAFAAAGTVHDFGSGLKGKQAEARAHAFMDAWLPHIGLEMTHAVRQRFLARTGFDSRLIASELDKLRCYCGDRSSATEADVQTIVSGGKSTEIWDLLDAFGRRRHADLIAQLRIQLIQSESPIRLSNSLETRVNDLLVIREALDRSWAVSEGYAGLRWAALPPAIDAWFGAQDNDMRKWPGFRVGKLVAQAGAWTLRDLRVARHLIAEMREKLVSSSLPQEWLLEVYLLRALGRRSGRQASR